MKKKFYLYACLGILTALGLYSCFSEFDSRPNGEAGKLGELTIIEAQAYFEDYAADFTLAAFKNSKTRSGVEVEITPFWDESSTFKIGGIPMVEVPLNVLPSYTGSCRDSVDLDGATLTTEGKVKNTMTYLLAEKDEDGDVSYRVVRIVADSCYLGDTPEKTLELSVSKTGDFSGKIFYYDLSGDLIDGVVYREGRKIAIIRPAGSVPQEMASSGTRGQTRGIGNPTCTEWVDYTVWCWYWERTGEIMPNLPCYTTWGESYLVCASDDEGGSGSGGVGGGSAGIAPFAYKIWDISKLTLEQQKKLEEMLKKIMLDCMGGKLYSELVRLLEGKTMSIEFTNSSTFSLSGEITLTQNPQSNELLHELFHLYQLQSESNVSFFLATLNMEVEAWCAQYMYVAKQPEYKKTDGEWYKRYNGTPPGKAARKLGIVIGAKGQYNSSLDGTVKELEKGLANELKKMDAYKDYIFDKDRSTVANLKNIQYLSKDC